MTLPRMAGNASFSLFESRVTHQTPQLSKSGSASVMAAEARSSRSARGKSSAADVAGREPMFSEIPEDGLLLRCLTLEAGCTLWISITRPVASYLLRLTQSNPAPDSTENMPARRQ